MIDGRVKVACINWNLSDAPHAVTYVLVDGEAKADTYYTTWEQAMIRANDLATRIRGAR